MAEVMPMQIRARGNAFATGIGNWLVSPSTPAPHSSKSSNNNQVSTFWAQVSPTALKSLTWKFYFLFVGKFLPASNLSIMNFLDEVLIG
jgi:hypothetical protein